MTLNAQVNPSLLFQKEDYSEHSNNVMTNLRITLFLYMYYAKSFSLLYVTIIKTFLKIWRIFFIPALYKSNLLLIRSFIIIIYLKCICCRIALLFIIFQFLYVLFLKIKLFNANPNMETIR